MTEIERLQSNIDRLNQIAERWEAQDGTDIDPDDVSWMLGTLSAMLLMKKTEQVLKEPVSEEEMNADKPNCYACAHRREIPGDCHSRCNNHAANVTGAEHGIRSGWFRWPINFDPVWLEECDGFSDSEEDAKAPTKRADPLIELLGLLR